jgi:asparagine synthase (glutamine-hydrolysing)
MGQLARRISTSVRTLPAPIAGTLARMARPHRARYYAMADAISSNPVERHISMMRVAHSAPPELLLRPLLGGVAPDGIQPMIDGCGKAQPALRAAMMFDQMVYLPGDILRKVDISTMGCGLEVRSPLLDEDLLTVAHSLPAELLVHDDGAPPHRWGKRVLKTICAREMGEAFVDRPKQGFGLPLQQWLDDRRFHQIIKDGFASTTSPISAWFERGALAKVWSDFQGGKRWLAQEVWNLMMLDAWAREYRPVVN